MIVAVPIVLMMEMTVHQVVHVIAVGNRRVATAWTMYVVACMSGAVVTQSAVVRVVAVHVEFVLVDMIPVRMVQMTVMEVVDVAVMDDRGMTAVRAMTVIVVGVYVAVIRGHVGHLGDENSLRRGPLMRAVPN